MRPAFGRLAASCAALAFLAHGAVYGADAFYLELLERGAADYAARDFPDAAKKLRIACFGLLDEPELLAEGLVRLSLAQMELGDRDTVRESFDRLLEIERRFAAYSSLETVPELRRELERALPRWIPEPALARAPVFADLSERARRARFETLSPEQQREELSRRLLAATDDAEALIRLSELDARQGRVKKAEKRLERILRRTPDHAGALCARGRLALASSDCPTALEDLRSCTRPLGARLEEAFEECRATLDDSTGAETGGQTTVASRTPPQRPDGVDSPPTDTRAQDAPVSSRPEPAADPSQPVARDSPETPVEIPPEPPQPAGAEAETTAPAKSPTSPESEEGGESPTPTPATPPAAPASVLEAVRTWARAWTEQRIEDYLSLYSTRFVPPTNLSRQAWAEQRRRRLSKPSFIKVDISDLQQEVDGRRASVTFLQEYESDLFRDRVRKTLELLWEPDGWRIVREVHTPP